MQYGQRLRFSEGSAARNVCVAATQQSHLCLFSEEMVPDVMDDNTERNILPMTITFFIVRKLFDFISLVSEIILQSTT